MTINDAPNNERIYVSNDRDVKAIIGDAKYVTCSYTKGYVSRKGNGFVVPYNGVYGKGYAHFEPNINSTKYSFVTYYVN